MIARQTLEYVFFLRFSCWYWRYGNPKPWIGIEWRQKNARPSNSTQQQRRAPTTAEKKNMEEKISHNLSTHSTQKTEKRKERAGRIADGNTQTKEHQYKLDNMASSKRQNWRRRCYTIAIDQRWMGMWFTRRELQECATVFVVVWCWCDDGSINICYSSYMSDVAVAQPVRAWAENALTQISISFFDYNLFKLVIWSLLLFWP